MQSQVALRNCAKDDKNKDVIAKVCVIDAIIKVMRDHCETIWPYRRRLWGVWTLIVDPRNKGAMVEAGVTCEIIISSMCYNASARLRYKQDDMVS